MSVGCGCDSANNLANSTGDAIYDVVCRVDAAKLICETLDRKLCIIGESINQSTASHVSEFTRQSVREVFLYVVLLRDVLNSIGESAQQNATS